MNKIIKVLTITIILIIILSSNIFADTTGTDITAKDIFSQAQDWTTTGKTKAESEKDTIDTSQLYSVSNLIFNILLGAGTAVAVIVGAILGIQFMIAGIDEKVEVKKALPAYIISCIVLFGSLGIWKLIVTILASLE